LARKKPKPHRALRRDITDEQADVLNHLVRAHHQQVLTHLHPQRGFHGEIQPIAYGSGPEGEMLVRLDRIPTYRGVLYTEALAQAFPEFPACLDLRLKGWTPASMLPQHAANHSDPVR
jgi:hypothetical protein